MRRAPVRFVPLLMAVVLLLVAGCAPAAAPSPTSAPKPAPTTAAPKPAPPSEAPKPAPTAAAPAAAPTAAPAAQPTAKPSAVSFQGKTVTVLVPYSPGGAADIMIRQFAPTFQKYLPGNPTVIIQNMPGAGGIVGENWVYNAAPKDGTVIGQFSTVFSDALFNPTQVQLDLAKLQWLGSVSETQVTFVRSDLGVKSARELMESKKKMVVGDDAAQSNRAMPPRLFLSLLGVEYKFVGGFGSSGDMRAAIRRGEINMTQDSLSGYSAAVVPMVQEGVVVPLAQTGLIKDGQVVRDPRVPDVPTYSESAVALKGEAVKNTLDYRANELMVFMVGGLTRGWVYPPGVPEATVAAAREAIAKALVDPELREGYKKTVGFEVAWIDGKQAQETGDAIVTRFKSAPEAIERFKQLAKEGA